MKTSGRMGLEAQEKETDHVFASGFKKDRLQTPNIWPVGFEFVDYRPSLGASGVRRSLVL